MSADIARLCWDAAHSIYGTTAPSPAYARGAAELLFGTACKESDLRYRRQTSPKFEGAVGAFGIFQVELATAEWLLVDWLGRKPALAQSFHLFVFGNDSSVPMDWASKVSEERLIGALWRDDRLGAALCRVRYYAAPGALPKAGDIEGQARYWLNHYNGRGCVKHHSEGECVAQYMKSLGRHAKAFREIEGNDS